MIALPNSVKLTLLFAAIGTIASGALPGYPTTLDRKISATITVRITERDLSWVTPQIRPQVIARFKEALNDESWREWGYAGLLAIEDSETIKTLFDQWRTPDASSKRNPNNVLDVLVNNTPTAALLPLLAQHLDDTRIYSKGTVELTGDLAWRQIAATAMIDVITMRNEFPAATKAWAADLGRNLEKRLLMKPWWEHNKDLIIARRYAEAAWLPTATESTPPAATSAPSGVLPPEQVGRAKSAVPKAAPSPTLSTQPESDSTPWVLVIVMIAAATGLLWLLLKRRAK